MKSLISWREFGEPNAPSIAITFRTSPSLHEDAVIRYLENGTVYLASPGVSIDAFTGELIANKHELLTDGEYSWNTDLAYYVRKYHMELPKDFLDKVLGAQA